MTLVIHYVHKNHKNPKLGSHTLKDFNAIIEFNHTHLVDSLNDIDTHFD